MTLWKKWNRSVLPLLDYKSKFEEVCNQREEEHKLNISLQSRLDKLLKNIDSLRDQLALMNQQTYGSKKQKRKPNKPKTASVDHTKDKDDFDGAPGSIGMDSTSASAAEEFNGQTQTDCPRGLR